MPGGKHVRDVFADIQVGLADVTYSSICKIGDRETNEDSVLALCRGGDCCFVVADGLSAHGGGDVASRILVDTFGRLFNDDRSDNRTFLAGAFDGAQAEILSSRHDYTHMKTTGVALSIRDGRFSWGHIGDSRLYFFRVAKFLRGEKSLRGVKLCERTMDHSVPQMLVMAGEISEDDMRRHPDRAKLLRALGDDRDEPQYALSKERRLSRGDAFLLCTDGFWEHIPKDSMIATLRNTAGRGGDAGDWLDEMLAIVETAGADYDMDNYSAITVVV